MYFFIKTHNTTNTGTNFLWQSVFVLLWVSEFRHIDRDTEQIMLEKFFFTFQWFISNSKRMLFRKFAIWTYPINKLIELLWLLEIEISFCFPRTYNFQTFEISRTSTHPLIIPAPSFLSYKSQFEFKAKHIHAFLSEKVTKKCFIISIWSGLTGSFLRKVDLLIKCLKTRVCSCLRKINFYFYFLYLR